MSYPTACTKMWPGTHINRHHCAIRHAAAPSAKHKPVKSLYAQRPMDPVWLLRRVRARCATLSSTSLGSNDQRAPSPRTECERRPVAQSRLRYRPGPQRFSSPRLQHGTRSASSLVAAPGAHPSDSISCAERRAQGIHTTAEAPQVQWADVISLRPENAETRAKPSEKPPSAGSGRHRSSRSRPLHPTQQNAGRTGSQNAKSARGAPKSVRVETAARRL